MSEKQTNLEKFKKEIEFIKNIELVESIEKGKVFKFYECWNENTEIDVNISIS